MILDTSAVVAVLLREPGFEDLLHKIASSSTVAIGAPTLVEASIVLSARMRRDARSMLSRFVMEGSIAVVPFGETHFAVAVQAWLQFGKGRHPASLNFGDCLSYAIARTASEPLLFVGDDLSKTDVSAA